LCDHAPAIERVQSQQDGGETMSSPGAGADGWRQCIGRVGVWVGPGALEQDPGGFRRLGGAPRLRRALGRRQQPWPKVVRPARSGTLRIGPACRGDRDHEHLGLGAVGTRPAVATLEAAHPGRFVLGLGVSHAPAVQQLGRRYERPLEAMTAFSPASTTPRWSAGRTGARPRAQGAGSLGPADARACPRPGRGGAPLPDLARAHRGSPPRAWRITSLGARAGARPRGRTQPGARHSEDLPRALSAPAQLQGEP